MPPPLLPSLLGQTSYTSPLYFCRHSSLTLLSPCPLSGPPYYSALGPGLAARRRPPSPHLAPVSRLGLWVSPSVSTSHKWPNRSATSHYAPHPSARRWAPMWEAHRASCSPGGDGTQRAGLCHHRRWEGDHRHTRARGHTGTRAHGHTHHHHEHVRRRYVDGMTG